MYNHDATPTSRGSCGCEQNLHWYCACPLRECFSFEVAICDLKSEARTAYDLAGGSRKPIFLFGILFGISSGAMSSLMASMRS